MSPRPGQRWISSSEPTLGLGHLLEVDGDRVEIYFGAADEKRLYAMDSAPIVRVKLEAGDDLGDQRVVERVEEDDGLLIYHGDGWSLSEDELPDNLSFVRPDKRLLAGFCDAPREYDLRSETLKWNARIRQSPARGFMGARIELIPHQMAIALEGSNRLQPRLMLADEVGLGKTIEACLILHHLLITGRAGRCLILVPEPLIHQWFVEMLRRFNMTMAIFDEERCASIEAGESGANPFMDSQWVLTSTDFLAGDPERAKQAADAGFDVLIVDEAHHLDWAPGDASDSYKAVEQLAAAVPSLLLLTATPQQLGPEGHFARLRLLDPERYHDLDAYAKETEGHVGLAKVVEPDGELTGSALIGTPAYMAPEQASSGTQEITPSIDVYAIGVVLYESLCGVPPFRSPSPAETLRRVTDDKIVVGQLQRPSKRSLHQTLLGLVYDRHAVILYRMRALSTCRKPPLGRCHGEAARNERNGRLGFEFGLATHQPARVCCSFGRGRSIAPCRPDGLREIDRWQAYR